MIDLAEALDVTSPASITASLGSSETLAGVLDSASILGVGWTARTVRELQVVAHGITRVAVARHGFRSLLLEGDVVASAALDRFVTTGDGDPGEILAGATPYLASEELLALMRWVRHHNERHADRPIRIVHGGRDDIATPLAVEESLVDQITGWHADHGDGILHIGGVAHVAIDPDRHLVTEPDQRVPTAGALLHELFGYRHKAIGLTFGRGEIPTPIPRPSPGFVEAELAALAHTSALRLPADVEATRLRVVGAHYDPAADARHAMVGDPITWFDAYVHQPVGRAALAIRR